MLKHIFSCKVYEEIRNRLRKHFPRTKQPNFQNFKSFVLQNILYLKTQKSSGFCGLRGLQVWEFLNQDLEMC